MNKATEQVKNQKWTNMCDNFVYNKADTAV